MSRNQVQAIRVGHRCPDVVRIVHDPELYDRVSKDGDPASIAIPEGPLYILGTAGEPASLFIEHGHKIHFMVLKPFRRYARLLLEASIAESGLTWMYCEIPEKFMETINFAKRMGFVETAVSEPSYPKGGEFWRVRRLERK